MPGPDDVIPSFYRVRLTDPSSIPTTVIMNSGLALFPGFIDTREAHTAELPAFGGLANAHGLAVLYRVLTLGGEVDGVPVRRPRTARTYGRGRFGDLGGRDHERAERWSLGFCKSVDNHHREPGDQDGVVLSEEAFGHVGMGGSIGFADPRLACRSATP